MAAPLVTTLPAGPTSTTARLILDLATRGQQNYQVRELAEQIVARVAARDQLSEVLAVYHWVGSNIRYVNDPRNVELVRDAPNVLKNRAGDCDDMVVLLGALLLCLGRQIRVVTGGFQRPGIHSHTWVDVNIGGRWVTLDPVANVRTSSMLGRVTSARLFY